jgi:putative ABC transport system permease protein
MLTLLQGDRRTCLNDRYGVVVTESFARKWFGSNEVMGRELIVNDTLRFHVTGVVQDFTNTMINEKVEILRSFYWTKFKNIANSDDFFPKAVNFTGANSFLLVREGTKMLGREKEFTNFIVSFWPSFIEPPFICKAVLQPLNNLYFSGYTTGNDNLRLGNKTTVVILLAVGLIILLFAVMNYINLTVAQSGYRLREAATHRLFGASRAAIMRRFVLESTVLCLLSFMLALVFAMAVAPSVDKLLGVHLTMGILFMPIHILTWVAFIMLIGILSGIIPAFILSRTRPIEVIRGTIRKQTKMVLSRVFIVFQNIITIVMLACALIMPHQLRHLIHAPLGFNTKQLIVITQYDKFAGNDFYTFVNRLSSIPQVKMVVPSCGTPQNGGNNNTVVDSDGEHSYQFFVAEPGFMKIWGLSLKDDHHVAHRPAIYLNTQALRALKMKTTDTHMSETFKKIDFLSVPKDAAFGGVLNDFKIRNILDDSKQPMLLCVVDKMDSAWGVTIQVEGDMTETYQSIAKLYREVFHEELNEPYPFVNKAIEHAFESDLRTSHIIVLFAFIAILISLLGLIAMSTYFIQQRNKEIAIRKVFGSTSNQMRRKLILSFLTYVAVAFVISVPIIWYFINGWITQYSYRITWWPWIIVAGIIVLFISFCAVAIQSYVASNENPVNHIKQE